MFKVREDDKLACKVFIYVDDARITSFSKVICWKVASTFSKKLTFLCLQDAARKRIKPTTLAGPLAGSVAHTRDGVVLLVSQKKWDRVRTLVKELVEMSTARKACQKHLEHIRGFL